MNNFTFWLSGWLCRAASWLRGEKWYVADAWHGVPGNRASELRQNIWQKIVVINVRDIEDNKPWLDEIDRDLLELSQAAGESWGHIWPKEPKP